ncbi:MAG: SusC/RagA family TonB-linked outer membrane protein [Arachidicoccus sp.]|nr:SusC/RagA family TonB-linked outer membrane protein [Arachidicoccus sp.]
MQKKLCCKAYSNRLLIGVSILLLCFTISVESYSQTSGQKLYSFTWRNTPLSSVITQIQQATHTHFSYNPKDIDLSNKVTLDIRNKNIEQVVGALSGQINTNYKIDGNDIFLQAIQEKEDTQKLLISGNVYDENNSPLSGVTILNSRTKKMTSTTVSGKFIISVLNGDVITFKSIGYTDFYLTASENKTNVNITLKPESNELNTVVVTALGIKREERALGYSYSEVDGDDIKKARQPNVINSLEGRVPGLIITEGAGGPAGASRVIIRGNTSITGNNQPLYVVDGVPIDNSNYGSAGSSQYASGQDFGDAISAINPDDVDKISVLKGASAAALYGSRAANGVILITTKKGTNKKDLGIELNSTTSIENQLTHATGNQYIYGQGTAEQLVTDAAQAQNTLFTNFGPRLDPNLQVIGFDGVYRPYSLVKNNIQDFFRLGSTYTNTLSFANSNDISGFRLSASDLHNNDILPGSHMRRNTFNFSGNSKFGNRINLQANLMYMNEDVVNRPSLADDPGNIGNNFLGLANNVDQAYFKNNYKDAEGHYVEWGGGQYHLDPYWVINEMKNETTKNRIIGNLTATYTFTSWLNLMGRGSTDFTYFEYNKYSPISTPEALTGELDNINRKISTTQWDFLLTAQKQVSSFWLSARIGGSILKSNNYGTTGQYVNMTITDVVSPNSFSEKSIIASSAAKQINSFYGLFSGAYKNWLYLDATLRRDASSTLPENNNTYTYPSVSASFVFTDAFKMKKSVLSYGKIRVSGAEVGTDTDPYQLNLYYTLYPQSFNSQSLGEIATTTLPNKNLKPTQTTSFETGTELKFFQDRLGLDATYYTSKSKNQINLVASPYSSGFAQQIINAGDVGNKGVEIQLNGKPIVGKDFTWDLSVNYAKNTNTVESLASGVPYLTLSDARWLGVSIVAMPGQPYGAILGYDYQRDPQGNIILNPTTLAPMQSDSRTVLGKGTWSWTGGLVNSFYYKNFGLTMVLDVKQGAKLFSMTNLFDVIRGSSATTLTGRAEWIQSEEERQSAGMTAAQWAAAGKVRGYVPQGVVQTGTDASGNPVYTKNTTAIDPSIYWANFYSDGNGIATPFIYNASYIKMREITFNYQLPKKLLSKWKIKDMSVAVVSRNPFIIHKDVPNVDPDSNYDNGNGQGLEYGSLPSRKSWGININIKF